MLAREWDRNRGIITYEGSEWFTITESADECLLIDIKWATSVERKSTVVKGQKVGE